MLGIRAHWAARWRGFGDVCEIARTRRQGLKLNCAEDGWVRMMGGVGCVHGRRAERVDNVDDDGRPVFFSAI